jgi:tRNA threonylcarbamoyladenosine biosynthesis protein TsaE
MLYHFDLYRVNDPEELEWMGIRDYLRPDAQCFIEWPERGAWMLPPPDLDLVLTIEGLARHLTVTAGSLVGKDILRGLED